MQNVTERTSNPFDMDPPCEDAVFGFGDPNAHIHVVGDHPGIHGGTETGIPFTGDAAGRRLQRILGDLGFSASPPDAARPDLEGAYLTYATRCRHPERGPTDREVGNCDPFLTADLRMINPEIIVPVGDLALRSVAAEHTTRDAESLDAAERHATTIRGRGFELVPMRGLDDQTDAETAAFVDHVRDSVLDRDYRQTKGRSGARD